MPDYVKQVTIWNSPSSSQNYELRAKVAHDNIGAGFYTRNISYGTGAPSGGAADNIYLQYSAENIHPVIDIVYPVGSIYLSVNNTNPGTLFGGTWVQVCQGRALWGAGTYDSISYVADSTKERGLPNISGKVAYVYSDFNKGNTDYANKLSGPFYYNSSEDAGTNQNLGTGTSDAQRQIYMDLSRANSIYGASTTVQPACYIMYVWKRTA